MPEIIIEITKETGNIKLEGVGFQGGQCVKDINDIEELLGMRTTSQRMKPEYQRLVKVQKVGR